MTKPLSDLAAVTLAREAELMQARPSPAVVAACDLFMTEAVRLSASIPHPAHRPWFLGRIRRTS